MTYVDDILLDKYDKLNISSPIYDDIPILRRTNLTTFNKRLAIYSKRLDSQLFEVTPE